MTRPARMQVLCSCVKCGTTWYGLGCNDASKCGPCKLEALKAGTRYRAEFIGRDVACSAISAEIKSGRLKPASHFKCVDCGKQACDYDHRDYNKPLEVQPVCRSCNLNRGPAKPIDGVIEACIEFGRVPYRSLASTKKLFKTLGLNPSILDGYPARLTAEHWAKFWPERANA